MTRFVPIVNSPEPIADQLNAFKAWDRDANLPDVISRADLLARPDLVAHVISERVGGMRGPEPPLALTFPKDDGTTRITCLLDPFDDVAYALRVSRLAGCVERALPQDTVVQSTRFRQVGRGFGAEGWRAARRRRGTVVDRKASSGVGGFDVASHFGSVRWDTLALVMHSCMVTDGACEELLEFLDACGAWPGSPDGLPAGPMASALLGTAVLLPADRVLARLQVPYERWVDDFVIAAPTEDGYVAAREAVNEVLAVNGQSLNQAKDWYNQPAELASASLDGFELSDLDNGQPDFTASALAEAIATEDPKRCRSILGGMRSREDGGAVPLVATNDVIWELAPKYAGDYLLTCRGELTHDHLDEMTERCSSDPTDRGAAGIAHCARVLAKRRVPGELGSQLHEAAERISTGRFRAAAPFLYHASSVSKEKPRVRCERAIDTAGALRDVLSSRGLIAGLRYDSRSRVVDDGLRALARARTELAPTVAWVRRDAV